MGQPPSESESTSAAGLLLTLSEKEFTALWELWKQKLNAGDFLTFCREILKLKTPRHYARWWDLAQTKQRLLIEAHRDSWKSFFWSRAYPLFRAVTRPGTTICLVSYAETQARKNLYWIKQMLETAPDLRQFVPRSNTFTWQKTLLHLTNGSSIEAKGFGSAMRGGHFDYIICDDILKDGSGMPHEDQQNFFFGVITPACRKTGQIGVIGTPLEYGDLLEVLEKNDTYSFQKYPVLVDGRVWFDEEYDLDQVEKWKNESPNYWYFAREYMLQRINPDKASFKPSCITYYDRIELEDKRLFKVMTMDPALSEKGDYNGIVVTGTDEHNTTYVLDSVKLRGELSVIVDRVFALYEKHEPDLVGCEMFGFQKYLKFWLEDEMARRNKFFIVHQLEAGQKRSKPMRILGLQPKIEIGKLKFRKLADADLVNELLVFDFTRRDNADDLIDSLAYQVNLWRMPEKLGRPKAPEGSFDKALDAIDTAASDSDGREGYLKKLFEDMTPDDGDSESPYISI